MHKRSTTVKMLCVAFYATISVSAISFVASMKTQLSIVGVLAAALVVIVLLKSHAASPLGNAQTANHVPHHPNLQNCVAGPRHFLNITSLSSAEVLAVLGLAAELKRRHHSGSGLPQAFAGKQMALVFTKPSLRTRASFETGCAFSWTVVGRCSG